MSEEPALGQVSTQNDRGEWVPAIPEPLFIGFLGGRAKCACGQKFKDRQTYRGHYALVHILALS